MWRGPPEIPERGPRVVTQSRRARTKAGHDARTHAHARVVVRSGKTLAIVVKAKRDAHGLAQLRVGDPSERPLATGNLPDQAVKLLLLASPHHGRLTPCLCGRYTAPAAASAPRSPVATPRVCSKTRHERPPLGRRRLVRRATPYRGVTAEEGVLVNDLAASGHDRARAETIANGDRDALRERRVGGLIGRNAHEVALHRVTERDGATCRKTPDIERHAR